MIYNSKVSATLIAETLLLGEWKGCLNNLIFKKNFDKNAFKHFVKDDP
jgi:hypothetical protein